MYGKSVKQVKDRSAHNRKTMSVTVAGHWPIYDHDNDNQVRIRGDHKTVEATHQKILNQTKKRDAKRR